MQKIAIIGVKENLGYELLNLFSENGFSPKSIIAIETQAPLGTIVSYGEDHELDVVALDNFDFNQTDIAIFCSPKAITQKYLPKASTSTCKIIDLTEASFSNASVPCIIPGINCHLITPETKIISIRETESGQLYGIRWNPDEKIMLSDDEMQKLHRVVHISL